MSVAESVTPQAVAAQPPHNALMRRIGGLPVWQWGLLVGVAVLAVVAWRMKSAQEPAESELSPQDEPSAEFGVSGSDGGSITDTGGFSANDSPFIPPLTVNPTFSTDTNDKWARRAIEWLSANGSSPGVAHAAIYAFINGDQLSYDQGALRDKAVSQFGWPPEEVLPGGTSLMPAKRQFAHPPGTHVVKNSNDNTYGEIANLYYGSAAQQSLSLLANANKSLGTSGPFAPGARVYVPVLVAPKYVIARRPGYDEKGEIASKNSISIKSLEILNPGMHFPVKDGARVRVR